MRLSFARAGLATLLLCLVPQAACQSGSPEPDPGGAPGGKGDHLLPGLRVLVVPTNSAESNAPADFGSDDHCFYGNGLEIAEFYRSGGSEVEFLPVNTPDYFLEEVDEMIERGEVFDRVIFLGHGNGNGPTFCCGYLPQPGYDYPQRSPRMSEENLAYLQRFGEALQKVTSPTGWIYVGACNPGKPTDFPGFENYLETLSCISGRPALGTSTKTACWDVTRRIRELEGPNHRATPGLVAETPCDVENTADAVTCAPLEAEVDCALESFENDWGGCTLPDGTGGVCQDTGDCGGTSTPGLCPGPASIQCCT